MMAKDSVRAPPVEWGLAGRALAGEIESGDLHLVAPHAGGVLIAVADGLGHGPEAAVAARLAAESLAQDPGISVIALIERCHAALTHTRGVVLSLAAIDAGGTTLTWAGVGNVDGTLYRAHPANGPARESLPHRGGVVGYQLPRLRAATLAFAPGDTLVFATDGITSSFATQSLIGWHPQDAADHILSTFGKDNDDALVLVARNIGPAS